MVSNLDCEQTMNIDESQMWHIQNISVAAALSKVRSILIVWTCGWLVWKFLFPISENSSIDFAYWSAKPHWQVLENTKKTGRLKGRKAVTTNRFYSNKVLFGGFTLKLHEVVHG